VNSSFCQSIFISIANPRVYHRALHSVSDSNKEFGMPHIPKIGPSGDGSGFGGVMTFSFPPLSSRRIGRHPGSSGLPQEPHYKARGTPGLYLWRHLIGQDNGTHGGL